MYNYWTIIHTWPQFSGDKREKKMARKFYGEEAEVLSAEDVAKFDKYLSDLNSGAESWDDVMDDEPPKRA
jgi:hypothetical protein